MSLLAVTGLDKAFAGFPAVGGVSLEVTAGELVAMIGPNGAGKSTTFQMIGGQLRPDRGTVVLDGDDITGLPARAIWRRGVGRTFQVAQAFESMTAAENVQMALISRHRRLRRLWRPAAALYRTEATAVLERVGMADQAERVCGYLAYGDIKRVELAVALASEPRLLLMDEPTAGMAGAERRALMALAREIVREAGIGVLFTEHDMDVVFGHADRIIVLNRGEVIARGAPEEVRGDPHVAEVYFGSSTAGAASPAAAGER